MKQSKFLPGWDEKRVRKVLAHYAAQTEEEAVAEDETAFEDPTQTKREKRPSSIYSDSPNKSMQPTRYARG